MFSLILELELETGQKVEFNARLVVGGIPKMFCSIVDTRNKS